MQTHLTIVASSEELLVGVGMWTVGALPTAALFWLFLPPPPHPTPYLDDLYVASYNCAIIYLYLIHQCVQVAILNS